MIQEEFGGWMRIGPSGVWFCYCRCCDYDLCWKMLDAKVPASVIEGRETIPCTKVVLPAGVSPVGLKRRKRKR